MSCFHLASSAKSLWRAIPLVAIFLMIFLAPVPSGCQPLDETNAAAREVSPAPLVAPVLEQKPPSNKLFQISIAALAAAHVADTATSWGRPELNPVLAGRNSTFDTRSVITKSLLTAGLISVEMVILRFRPGARRHCTWINFITAGTLGAVAVHNQMVGGPR